MPGVRNTTTAVVQTSSGVAQTAAAIPSSAVYRWPVVEGTGQTWADVVGSADLSANYTNWISGSQYQGGAATEADGTDDYARTSSALSEVGINQNFSIEIWAEPQSLGGSSTGVLFYQHTANTNRVSIGMSNDENGDIAASMYNGSFVAQSSTSISTNDGLKHIVYTFDPATNDGKLYLDKSEGGGSKRPNFTGGAEDNMTIASHNDNATHWDGIIDLIQVHDEVLSQSQIDSLYSNHPST